MPDENNTKNTGHRGDGDDFTDDRFSPMWKFRSENVFDSAGLPMNHGHAPEPDESTGLFAILAQDDVPNTTRSEIPSVPSSVHTPAPSSTSEDTDHLSRCSSIHEVQECDPLPNRRGTYLGPSMLQGTTMADLTRAESTSTLSSTSGDGLTASHWDDSSAPESPEARPPVWRGHSAHNNFPFSHPEPSRPTSVPTTLSRRDGPGYPSYPNQSFAALQSQIYTPSYPPRPLRARNSHGSQNSLNTSSTSDSRYPPTMASGARTVGSTPIHSPRLFTPTISRNRASGDESEDSHYNTPLLHHTHLQAPIE